MNRQRIERGKKEEPEKGTVKKGDERDSEARGRKTESRADLQRKAASSRQNA